MKKETNVERFHAWMERIGNIHIANGERMARAYHIVATN